MTILPQLLMYRIFRYFNCDLNRVHSIKLLKKWISSKTPNIYWSREWKLVRQHERIMQLIIDVILLLHLCLFLRMYMNYLSLLCNLLRTVFFSHRQYCLSDIWADIHLERVCLLCVSKTWINTFWMAPKWCWSISVFGRSHEIAHKNS